MKIIIQILSSITFFLLFACCTTGKKQEKDSSKINLIHIPIQTDETHLSPDSLFDGKEIIALETTSESLISSIDKIQIKDSVLYILDDTQDIIFLFNHQGKYLQKINHIGRAPNEYYHISDFHIDDTTLYVVAGGNQKILCYDLTGNFLKSFNTDYPCDRITTDSAYIYIYYNFSHPDGHNVGIYNKQKLQLHKRYKSYPRQQAGIGNNTRCWVSFGNKVFASFPYEYNIYQLSPDTCKIINQLDYGKNYMFPKNWKNFSPLQEKNYILRTGGIENSPIIYSCHSLFQTSTHIIFTFIYKCHLHIALINKTNNTVQYGILWPNSYYWNVHGLNPVYISDEYMIASCKSALIINYRNIKGLCKETIKEFSLKITNEDNPCLYFYKLRK